MPKQIGLHIEYDPNGGTAIPDALALGVAEALVKKYDAYKRRNKSGTACIKVAWANELPFYCIRLLVKHWEIPASEVTFHYKDKEITLDQNGRPRQTVAGFCDASENILLNLL